MKDKFDEMLVMLSELNKEIKKAIKYSEEYEFKACERTLKHVLGHIQTLQESSKNSDPGFTL